MENELNVLPTEDVTVETLPVETTKNNTTRNVIIGLGLVTLVGGLTYLGVKFFKNRKAKKAAAAEQTVEAKEE